MERDIVLVNIFFTDLSDYKVRPVLLIKQYKKDNFLYLPLSSNLNLHGVIVRENDLEDGDLIKESIVVIPKIGILHKDLILKKIAVLAHSPFKNVMKDVCQSLNCKEYCKH